MVSLIDGKNCEAIRKLSLQEKETAWTAPASHYTGSWAAAAADACSKYSCLDV
jgi:hypothetical protein